MLWGLKMNVISVVFLVVVALSDLSVSLFLLLSGNSFFIEWEIVTLNSSYLGMSLIIDWVSMMFLACMSFISSMVLFYSGSYMANYPNINCFMYLVLGFVLSMGL